MSTRNNAAAGANGAHRGGNPLHKQDTLPCHRCAYRKPLSSFAKSRIPSTTYERLTDDAKRKIICLQCNGAPVTEMQCHGPCGKVKAVDAFSANQRNNNPESARCKKCTYKREVAMPGAMPEHSDDEDAPRDANLPVSNPIEPRNAALSTAVLSLAEDDEYEQVTFAGRNTSRPATVIGSRNMSYDNATTAASSASESSFSGINLTRLSSVVTGSGGFAKVRAAPNWTSKIAKPADDSDDEVNVAGSDDCDDSEADYDI